MNYTPLLVLIFLISITYSCEHHATTIKYTSLANSMTFTLSFSSKERSRDSRSSLITYKLQEETLSRKTSYKGARARPSSFSEVKLNADQIAKLSQIIEQWNLNNNYEKSLKSSSKGNSGIKRHYESIFRYAETLIKITGDKNQKEDPKAKQLKSFEYLLKYLIDGDLEVFEKRYQGIID